MAKDREAWRHVLLALDLLHHYQWNIALMKKVRNEMKLAIDRMAERLAAGSDENRAEDLRFFLSLLNDVESGIQNGNLLVMRSVEQSLIRHLSKGIRMTATCTSCSAPSGTANWTWCPYDLRDGPLEKASADRTGVRNPVWNSRSVRHACAW